MIHPGIFSEYTDVLTIPEPAFSNHCRAQARIHSGFQGAVVSPELVGNVPARSRYFSDFLEALKTSMRILLGSHPVGFQFPRRTRGEFLFPWGIITPWEYHETGLLVLDGLAHGS